MTEMTDLDEALASAKEDSRFANHFYDMFLNVDLFVPVQLEGTVAGSWRKVGPKDRFRPLFLSHEGNKVIPVFDRLERLESWAAERPLDFLVLRSFLFLNLVAPGVALVLNPGIESTYYFPPDLLTRLREAAKPVTPS